MSSKNHKQKFIIGGVIAALGLGFVAFKQMKGQDVKQNQQIQAASIDRVTIIKVLKELKKEMFTVFQNFSAVSQNIKQQSMGRARPEEIKMMLLEQPMFRGEIDAVEDAVYSSFGVTKEQVKHYCENIYREDPEIKELQRSMKDSFDKSFQGIAPDSHCDIPQFLTPELTFEILEKIMTESALKLNEKLLELQEAGEQISIQNPKMLEVMQSLKMDGSKKQILQDYGLEQYDDPGTKILQFATQKYSQGNTGGFNQKMSQLDVKYQGIMEQLLMGGPMSHEDLKEKMKQQLQGMPRGPFGQFSVPQQQPQQQEKPIEQQNELPEQNVQQVKQNQEEEQQAQVEDKQELQEQQPIEQQQDVQQHPEQEPPKENNEENAEVINDEHNNEQQPEQEGENQENEEIQAE